MHQHQLWGKSARLVRRVQKRHDHVDQPRRVFLKAKVHFANVGGKVIESPIDVIVQLLEALLERGLDGIHLISASIFLVDPNP
eukprot:scaffold2197_cov339-Pinguiococcus_pyrenoidosus.AAC.4